MTAYHIAALVLCAATVLTLTHAWCWFAATDRAYRDGLKRGGEIYTEAAKAAVKIAIKESFDNGFKHGVDRLTTELEKVIPERVEELKEHWTAVQRAQGEGTRRSN